MPQVGTSISTEKIKEIKEMADSERRSLSEMIAILIDEATIVRNNKKKK